MIDLNKQEAPIVSPRKYAEGERHYRELKRIRLREERTERKATERAAYLKSLKFGKLAVG